MRRRWTGVAVATGWLIAAGAAEAQYPPAPAGPAPFAEPVPYAVAPPGPAQPPGGMPPGPGMPPGMGGMPFGPGTGPEGDDGLSRWKKHAKGGSSDDAADDGHGPPPLPGNLPNAFTKWRYDPCCDQVWYVYTGGMLLQRQRLGHGTLADLDPNNVDTGTTIPQRGQTEVANFNALVPKFESAVRATVGYHWECQALEVTGYYVGGKDSAKIFADPGRLDLFFFNAPRGFEGDNGLWLQADAVRLGLETTLGNAEANYRWWLGAESTFAWLVGVRYLDLDERLSIFTDDDGLSIKDANGNPDPLRQADYIVRAHNRILAPQLGLEYNRPLTSFVAVSLSAKGAWGLDFLDEHVFLRRGDGALGIAGRRENTFFSHLYETGLFFDWKLSTRARLRTGYNTLWVLNVAEAVDQVDFNLAHPAGQKNEHGSIFYHGPVIEFQVIF